MPGPGSSQVRASDYAGGLDSNTILHGAMQRPVVDTNYPGGTSGLWNYLPSMPAGPEWID